MLNKNDPLIGAVQEVMKKNQAERDAVRLVNEKFGVTDRKALPHEKQGAWDAAYKQVLSEGMAGSIVKGAVTTVRKLGNPSKADNQAPNMGRSENIAHQGNSIVTKTGKNSSSVAPSTMKEELKGNQHKIDANKNGRVDGHDFKLLRAKKKPMEEENAPKTDPHAEGQASSISTVSQPKKEVTPADQSALKKKIMSIKEAKANPYAIGMAAVKKSTGDEPPMEKKNIMKAHKIAKKIIAKKKMNEGFNNRHGLSVTASAEKQAVAEQTRARSDYGLGSIPAQKNAAQRRAELDARMEKGIDTVAPFVPGVGAMRAVDKYAKGEQGLGQTAADVGLNLAGGAILKGISKGFNYLRGGKKVATASQKLLPRSNVSPAAREPAAVSSATAKVAPKSSKSVSQSVREPDEIIMPAKKPDIPSGNAGIRGTFQDKLARARQNAGSDLKARQLPALRRTTEPTNYVRPGVPAVKPQSGPNLPARPGSPNLAAGGATRIVGLSDKAKAGLAAGAAGAAIGGYALNRSLSGNQPPAAQASTTSTRTGPSFERTGRGGNPSLAPKADAPAAAPVPVPKPKPEQLQAQPQVTKKPAAPVPEPQKKPNALQQQMARSRSGRDEPAGPRKDAQGLNVHSMTRPQPGKPGVRK